MYCIACGLITTEISPHVGRNIPVSVSGCHATEMMPQCLQNELDLGVRLAHKNHLSPQDDCLKTKMNQVGM